MAAVFNAGLAKAFVSGFIEFHNAAILGACSMGSRAMEIMGILHAFENNLH